MKYFLAEESGILNMEYKIKEVIKFQQSGKVAHLYICPAFSLYSILHFSPVSLYTFTILSCI